MLRVALLIAVALATPPLLAQDEPHPTCGALESVQSPDVIFQSSASFLPVQYAFTDLKPRKDAKANLVVAHDPRGSVYHAHLDPKTGHKFVDKQLIIWGMSVKFTPGKCGKAIMPITLLAKPR